jgi:hypothetical protein
LILTQSNKQAPFCKPALTATQTVCTAFTGQLLVDVHLLTPTLTSLLPYPTTQPLTWPFLIALEELRRLEETATMATNWSRKYGSYFRAF